MEENDNKGKRLLLGGVAVFAFLVFMSFVYRGISSYMTTKTRNETSDATEITATVKIAVDDYWGYWFAMSSEMRAQARSRGIALEFIMEPDYKRRVEMLQSGEVQMIFIPISSYVEHAAKDDYPGVAFLGLAGSKGADSIWTYKSNVPNGKITDLNDSSKRWVYVRGSVSELLVDATVHTLDLTNLTRTNIWRKPVADIEEVVSAARLHQGDVFVFWEPTATRAAAEIPELTRVWGSDKLQGYVKDVAISQADYVAKNEPVIEQIIESLFLTMRAYEADPNRMYSEMAKTSKIDEATIRKIMPSIDFYDLRENATLQFGIPLPGYNNPAEGLFTTIADSVALLRTTEKFSNDPLRGNYGKITYKRLLAAVAARMPLVNAEAAKAKFSPLDDQAWKQLNEVATLRIDPINFAVGEDTLSDEGKAAIDAVANEFVSHFPTGRIAIRGHTDLGSDQAASTQLSLARAQAVVQRFVAVHNFDPNRLHAEGYGFAVPPARRDGESERAYRNRWPRVEFVLLEGESF